MPFPRPSHKLARTAGYLIPVLVLLYCFGVALKYPLNDSDLWWHLKTGEYIVEAKSLPSSDLFSYTVPEPLTDNQIRGLRAQWLGQVFSYMAERTGGLAGVVFLRNLLIVLPSILLCLWLWRRKAGLLATLAVAAYPAIVFSAKLFYAFERPQGFSFALALVVVMLLERLRRRRGADFTWVLLPLAMAFWSNVHGGYIMGNFILLLYLSAEGLLLLLRKLRGSAAAGPGAAFFAVGALAIVFSFANPNTYYFFWTYLKSSFAMLGAGAQPSHGAGGTNWVATTLLEYLPLRYFYKQMGYGWLLTYWALAGVTALLLVLKYWMRRRVDLAELLAVAFLVLFAETYARGQLFSLAVLPFYAGKSIVELKDMGVTARAVSRAAATVVLMLSVAFGGYMYAYYKSAFLLAPGVATTWVTAWYPKSAAAFLRETPVAPPMYNFYNWGGFFIWSLYPKYKVFVDGRALSSEVNVEADRILNAGPGWRESLDARGVNFVVSPVVFRDTGVRVPLTMRLVGDADWRLVFLDRNTAIFLRARESNMPVIRSYAMPKKNVYAEVVRMEDVFLSTAPYHPVFNLEKADALFALGRYAQAKAIYEHFPSRSRHQLQRLAELGY
jgi:hypothetical protein